MSEYNKTNYETIKPFEPTNEIEQGYLDDILSVFENEIKVTGIKEYQSPYSTSKTVLIEYVSHPDFNWREDAVFNLLHDKDILDTSIDYTPITPDKSGTINDYLKRLQEESRFDREIEAFVRGELPDNHVFFLGLPGEILKKCGFPSNQMIDLTAYRLKQKSTQENHPFSPLDIKGLDKALQTPIAVFEYARSGNNNMQNVIVDIAQGEKHFLAGIVFNKKQNGFEVSNIRGLFPKDDYQWLHWVEQGKMIYGNKEKIQALSTQRRIDLADVSNQDARISSDIHCLDSIDTILGKFGSVNDIFTQEFSFYAQQKEFYSIYRKIHASFAWDAVYEDDARFYAEKIFKAIHEQDTDTLKQYASFEDVYEISDVVREILSEKSGFSTIQSQEQLNKAVSFVTQKKENFMGINEQAQNQNVKNKEEIWTWIHYSDGSGHVRSPNGRKYFVYDWDTKEYRVTPASRWEIYIDVYDPSDKNKTFDDFKKFAEQEIKIKIAKNPNVLFESIHIREEELLEKNIEEQAIPENERTNTQKQIIQGEKTMEERKLMYSNIHNDESYEKLDRPIENMSREEAVALLGEHLIKEVESLNCDYTNRVTDGTEWNGFTEFMSSLELGNNNYHINAYYYQKNEDVENTEDLSSLKWEVQKFELIPWDLSAGEALSLQGFTDLVIDYGEQGTELPGWRDFTEKQQEVLALAYYAFREQEERKLESDEYAPRAWEVLEVEDGWNRVAEELKEWVAREIDHGVGIWEGLNEIELQIVEEQARNVKERQRTIEVEEGDYRASSYAAIESYYQDFLEAGFNRDNTQKQTRVEEWSLTVKDYNACCFADSKEVSFLSFKYSCDEKAVRSTLNIQPSVMDIRSPGKLELEYRFDHLGKEEFLATDSLSQNFITYKDCEYDTPNKCIFPKEFKESLRNVAQNYTQTQFGKSIKEQFIAENERTKIPKQTIQGEKNMEQTEKKTPYYQQQIEKLHEAVKTGTAPFFLKEAVVGENNEVKNPGNYIEDNDKIILTPRPAVRTVKGNLLKGVNQLSAQIELDNMGSKAQTVLSFEDAKAAGTYIKKGSKSILLTGYDKDNERSKVYHVFSAGSVANKDVIKEQLYKNNELNKEKPWSKAIVCTDSNPEKYLGAYLAASASGSVLETDRKTVETFQKSFQSLIEKSISEKKHTAVFDVVRSAQMVKSEILKKNFSTWEKSQEQHKQGQQKGQQKKSPQSDMEMVF